jgi:D-arabinose 1-dehydrogenase-like Zn-dependent alcohol dehydrogenase
LPNLFFLQARFREQFCEMEQHFTYNSPDKHLEGKQTYGGYSTSVVVDENLYYAFQKI